MSRTQAQYGATKLKATKAASDEVSKKATNQSAENADSSNQPKGHGGKSGDVGGKGKR